MTKGVLICLIALAYQTGFTQIDTSQILNHALEKGNLMISSFQEGDYDHFLELIHPKIITLSGGRVRMKEMFQQGLGPGVELINTELSIPSELIVQDTLYQCVFSQKQTMRIDGQMSYFLSSLIGLSYDSGEHWKFIGVSTQELTDLKAHFPELSDELEVSPQTDPILIKE